jgi:hypothetical protein
MAAFGRHKWSRHLLACAAAVALFAAPARAFFFPTKTAITVPTYPVSTGKGAHSGGGTSGGDGGGSTPQSAPEPNSLLLALLGSGGVSLIAASRRRRKN